MNANTIEVTGILPRQEIIGEDGGDTKVFGSRAVSQFELRGLIVGAVYDRARCHGSKFCAVIDRPYEGKKASQFQTETLPAVVLQSETKKASDGTD